MTTCIRITPLTLHTQPDWSLPLLVADIATTSELRHFSGAARDRYELCLVRRTSHFYFFEVVDPPPEQDFMQGLEADRAAYFKRPRYRRKQ
jgi:hypothetical protein